MDFVFFRSSQLCFSRYLGLTCGTNCMFSLLLWFTAHQWDRTRGFMGGGVIWSLPPICCKRLLLGAKVAVNPNAFELTLRALSWRGAAQLASARKVRHASSAAASRGSHGGSYGSHG